jgi:hypothetical protein
MPNLQYDVFISHAYEDKSSFADELASALREKSVKLWYSGFELGIGDSIAGRVNAALASSRFGVVILSPSYLHKKWAMSELKALLAGETLQDKILPVLYNITIDEVRAQLPLLADRFAISSEKGTAAIVEKILKAIETKQPGSEETGDESRKDKSRKSRLRIISNSDIEIDSNSITVRGQLAIYLKIITHGWRTHSQHRTRLAWWIEKLGLF